ncbi:hypothetical protein BDZ97DRAFT_1754124 [Flammula alnicola]|nr:hypothetical protein BDZ97DRAFT_1754124 [Flammula alnicola]
MPLFLGSTSDEYYIVPYLLTIWKRIPFDASSLEEGRFITLCNAAYVSKPKATSVKTFTCVYDVFTTRPPTLSKKVSTQYTERQRIPSSWPQLLLLRLTSTLRYLGLVALGADLEVEPTNWRWIHCLTLPLEKLHALQFSQKPYKWIRYAIGVVVGAEGDLSTSSDSPNAVDYDAAILPADSADLYYHISNEGKRRIFPVDPQIVRTSITSSSVHTPRRDDFREEVSERDGKRCILTGFRDMYCDAVHLLAHSQGDTHRSRDSARGDIIEDIDDIRNGLFLNKLLHVAFGKDLAFLVPNGANKQTPNFALNTDDIDPTAPPTEKRCTSHVFGDDIPTLELHPRFRIQIHDTPEYPPAIVFDAVYAGAVLYHFGTQSVKGNITASWKDIFYPSEVMTMAHADYKENVDERATAAERKQTQDRERAARHEARCEARRQPDTFDMLMTLPYAMVPRNELQAVLREAKEKAEAAEQRRVQDKVDAWMRQVTDV